MLRAGIFLPKGKDRAPGFKREKNWGFVEEGGDLMIYYALLPCTVVLQFDMGQPDGVVMHARACYDAQAATIQQQTGKFAQMSSPTGCMQSTSRTWSSQQGLKAATLSLQDWTS